MPECNNIGWQRQILVGILASIGGAIDRLFIVLGKILEMLGPLIKVGAEFTTGMAQSHFGELLAVVLLFVLIVLVIFYGLSAPKAKGRQSNNYV